MFLYVKQHSRNTQLVRFTVALIVIGKFSSQKLVFWDLHGQIREFPLAKRFDKKKYFSNLTVPRVYLYVKQRSKHTQLLRFTVALIVFELSSFDKSGFFRHTLSSSSLYIFVKYYILFFVCLGEWRRYTMVHYGTINIAV